MPEDIGEVFPVLLGSVGLEFLRNEEKKEEAREFVAEEGDEGASGRLIGVLPGLTLVLDIAGVACC